MTPLERELHGLARTAFPATPDLAAAVRAALADEPTRGPAAARRRLLLAVVAALAVAAGAAFAVPQSRGAILRWLGVGGIHVQRVERLPEIPAGSRLDVGERVTLAEAGRRSGFAVAVPGRELGPPDAVFAGRFAVFEVTLLYGRPDRPRLLLTEASGRLDVAFAGKLAGPGTTVVRLRLNGRPALWIEGALHAFFFLRPGGGVATGTLRLARNTLLWQRGGLVLRIEGALTRAQALQIARSLG